MRMIDRQTAADLLDNLIGMFDDSNGNDYDAALRLGIDVLRADVPDTDISAYSDKLWRLAYEGGKAEAMRWIPVSERLPNNELAIVQYSDGDFDLLQFPTAYRWKDIVAWMPLPEPYKDGERDG